MSSALLALALAGCGRPGPGNDAAPAAATSASDADDLISCATQGDAALSRDCTVDRATTDRGLMLTLRHPDGHFHRLLVTTDGRGTIAADGAEPARVTVIGRDLIEVAIGRDRYRLPATVRKSANP